MFYTFKRSISFTVLLLFLFVLQGQTAYVALQKGDKVPDYTLTNLLNYPEAKAKLTDFKGKFIILDFWSTYCAACIESWPKLLALQKVYEGKLQIILINDSQNDSIVKAVFAKRKRMAGIEMSLPVSCGDTAITRLFPYSGLPHVVWIDQEGFVKAITDGSAVTQKNITSVLEYTHFAIRQKVNNNEFIKPDFNQPFFINGNGGRVDSVLFQSLLTKFPEKFWPGRAVAANYRHGGFYTFCSSCSVKDMYMLAYSNRHYSAGWLSPVLPNRVRLQLKDSSRYVTTIDGEIQYDNLYTYDLIAPPQFTTEKLSQQRMQEDLKRYFGLRAYWEKRKAKCLVLTADDTFRIQFKEGNSTFGGGISPGTIQINNTTINHFIQQLEETIPAYSKSPYPIVDETHFKGKLGGIFFDTEVGDYKELDKALQTYKMHLKLETRVIDVLIIGQRLAAKREIRNNK